MRFRNSRVRTKVAALLLSLAALWAFAAWVTLREGLNLLGLSTLDEKTGRPGSALVTVLQHERRLSLIYLGKSAVPQRKAMVAQRTRTDAAAATFRRLAGGGDVSRVSSDTGRKRIREALTRLNTLTQAREMIDARRVDRTAAATPFNEIIDTIFRIYGSSASVDDQAIAKDSRTLIALTRAKEVLSREDALLAGVFASGRFSTTEHAQFVQLVGAQRFLHEEAVSELPDADRERYDTFTAGQNFTRFRTMEDQLVQNPRARNGRPQVRAEEWQAAISPTLDELDRLVLTGGDDLVDRSRPVAIGVVVRLLLAGGLGLLAVIASIVVSITTARALVRQLEKLRAAAWVLAEERLPSVVERLGHGEKVDVAAEAPPLAFGNDEIGQVGQAFNAVQETAIRVAVEQAELRRGIRDILLSLARRSQALIHRQLTLLDAMERREMDTKELEDLFRLDHLATRMRRNAENLIVLSGATPARGWRRAVSMMDVVRAAVAEVEDYTRVSVLPMDQVGLTGRAVGDIAHLIAELIENAVSFSPPYTTAQVSGHLTASGYAVEIEDRGLGMTAENLVAINERIADPPEFNLSSSVQLGLYVVGRLAERYGVRVSLKRSPYGGTTAVVLIPSELLMAEGEIEPERPPQPAELAEPGLPAGDDAMPGSGSEALPPEAAPPGVADEADLAGNAVPDPSLAVASITASEHSISEHSISGRPTAGTEAPGLTAVPGSGRTRDEAAGPVGRAVGGPAGEPADTAEPDRLPFRGGSTRPGATTPHHQDEPVATGGLPFRGEPRLAAVPSPSGGPDHLPARPSAAAPGTAPGAAGATPGAPAAPGGTGGRRTGELPQPDDDPPRSEGSEPAMSHTPSGLPFRVPQASLAPPLRDDGNTAGCAEDDEEMRSPDELRTMLGAYQRGTVRGRTEAAKARQERTGSAPTGPEPAGTTE